MRKLFTRFSTSIGRSTALLMMLLLPLLGLGQGSTTIVISQIYGGGGNASATYKNDYVELHNVSGSSVSVAGYVLAYAAAGNAFAAATASNSVTLTGSIPAGGYYLVGLATGGTPGIALPSTDASNTTVNMSATAGKVVLASNSTTLNITPTSANTVDFVGFGSTASAFEGTAPAPSSTGNAFAFLRAGSGCTDTNQNGADFSTGTPLARNSASTAVICSSASINTPTFATTPICATTAASLDVTFTATGTFNAANNFTVQLSNASGSFTSPTTIATLTNNTTTTAQTVNTTIPAGTPSGTGYLIRVVASNPTTTSSGTSSSLTIVSSPTVGIAPTTAQSFVAGSSGNQLTATEAPVAAGNTRVWQYATVSGGPYTTIPSQTGLTYTPNFATPGVYYVVATSTFAACAAVTSNEVVVTVTAPPSNTINTPTFATTPICATTAASLDVTFTASGPYASTNTFLVQLSDASGSFAAAVTIATLANNNLNTAQTVNTTIPAGTPTGTGYRIQVVASNPAATSLGTSAALSILSNPTVSVAPAGTQTIAAGANGAQLTATETSFAGTTRVWEVASAATGPFTAISPAQTGLTYTPTFATAGTYFVHVLSTFAGCGAVASNAVEIDVTNAVPSLSNLSPVSAVVGGAAFTLTVNGSGFVSGAVVSFNGTALTTAFVNSGQLTASVPASAIATMGSFPVTVTNPAPTAGPSTALTFTVTAPILATYTTASLTGTTGSVSPATPLTPNVTASTITRGAGVSPASVSGGYSSSNWTTSATLDVSTNDYIAASVAPATNYQITVTSITFNGQRTAAGPQTVELLYSTSPTFANPVSLGSGTMPVASTDYTFSFSPTGTALQNITGTVYFRLFGYAATSTGNYILRNSATGVNALTVYGTVTNAPASPEINIVQGTTTLLSGAGTYTFATTGVGTSTAATQFDIQNLGLAPLSLPGTPIVAVSGDVADFTITQPTSASVAAGGSASFTIAFAPMSAGTKTATISIANDDSDENPYTFTVTGTPLLAPVVSNFTPPAGNVGTQVTVTGSQFTSTSTVSFNGTAATVVTINSATSLVATVPTGATTGPISVTNSVGTGTSSTNFTVTVPQDVVTGDLLLEENFAYAAGELLTAHGWTAYSSAATAPIATTAGNLVQAEYPRGFDQGTNPATFTGSTTARLPVSGQDVSRSFGTVTATTFYMSAVVSVTNPGSSGEYFMMLRDANNSTAGGDTRGRIFVQQSGTGFKFGLSLNGTTADGYTSTVYTNNTPYLVVVKINTAVAPNTASLYVYTGQADATEPTTPTLTASGFIAGTATGTLNSVALRQDDNAILVDGIRVATGWGNVIGKPVFTNPATSLATGNYYSVTVNNADRVTATGAVRIENILALTSGLLNTTSTNLVTLYASASTSGASTTSYVNGPLARIIGTTGTPKAFPIGSSTAYRPVSFTVTAQTAAATYVASVTEQGSRSRGLATGTALTRVSAFRYFTLTESGSTNFQSGTVTLPFGTGDGVTDLATLRLANSTGTSAPYADVDPAGTPATTGAPTSGTITAATTVLGDFALATTSTDLNTNPLPVELTAFSAQRQSDKSVVVRWSTASEKNSARFEVQRSLNSRDFVTVATEKAQGSSTQVTAYTSTDATAPAAQLYYRLRQVDLDGTVAYSPIAQVGGTAATTKVQLYPNPARTSVSFIADAATPYRVLNQLGQAVLHGTTEAGTAKVAIEALPTGLYFLELQTATGRNVQKFEKQ